MSVKDELLFDFSVNMPRVLVSGGIAIIDNVKRIVLFSDSSIVVHNGKQYTAAEGRGLVIKELSGERMMIAGNVEQIRFFSSL